MNFEAVSVSKFFISVETSSTVLRRMATRPFALMISVSMEKVCVLSVVPVALMSSIMPWIPFMVRFMMMVFTSPSDVSSSRRSPISYHGIAELLSVAGVYDRLPTFDRILFAAAAISDVVRP